MRIIDYVTSRGFAGVKTLKMAEWTRELTEKIIIEMEARPVLYDTKLKNYSNRDVRRALCNDIGSILSVSGKLFVY